jgi:hypothetical protein
MPASFLQAFAQLKGLRGKSLHRLTLARPAAQPLDRKSRKWQRD